MIDNWVDIVALALVGAAILLGLVRLWLGPGAPDRIVAADTLSIISVALLLLFSMLFESALYLDVALIYAVLAFAGIVALARAIEDEKE